MATPEPIVVAAAPARWRGFYELTKPRVVMLIVFTSIVGTLLAVPGMPPWDLFCSATWAWDWPPPAPR